MIGQGDNLQRLDLNKYLPDCMEINQFSLTADGKTGFFTASIIWEQQIPYLVRFDKDTVVEKITELDTIYNGAISPSGNQIIYAIRNDRYTSIHLIKKKQNVWLPPIQLSAQSDITGGYFHWYSETELNFYLPENNGDILGGIIQNDQLILTNRYESLNTEYTEFSPFMGHQKRYLIFTRYVHEDPTNQGLMISRNLGNELNPEWGEPVKIEGIPYAWGAFVLNETLYFTDGVSVFSMNFKLSDH